MEPKRCPWAGTDPLYIAYHDGEWGVPARDDRHLFEMLVLEGAQAGLSWITILKKREGYRRAFANFDCQRVARMTARDIEKLVANPEIVRNRAKIESAVGNAKSFIAVQEERGSFADYLWSFVDGAQLVNHFAKMSDVPPKTELSTKISKDLAKRGFRFIGPTIVYAYMQAVGVVNDHLTSCPRHREISG
ncbi:MAG: DNA-3-methyladenine glycosylase I [Polyangiaceae bacterium]